MLQVVENVGDTVVELKGRRREVAGRLIRSRRRRGVAGRRVSVVLGHSSPVPLSDLGKSELDVFGGDGLGASESGGEQSVVSEEIDFAWQAAARLEQGFLCGRLEEVEFGSSATKTKGEIGGELLASEGAEVVSDDDALRERLVDGHGEAPSQLALTEQ